MRILPILLISLISLASCSGSKMLLRSFNKYKAPLDYLHDSKITKCDTSSNTIMLSFTNNVFDSATSVSKLNGKVIPLIIYNYTEVNYGVLLGESSLQENYNGFFKQSFITESARFGCYSLKNHPDSAQYTVEIGAETIRTSSKYQINSTIIFLFLMYSTNTQEIGFPAETDLALNVKVRKAGDLIFEKNYLLENTQPFVPAKYMMVNKLREDFVSNMVESLSLSTKDGIEQIITDLNKVIPAN